MTLYSLDGATAFKAQTKEVFDVSGASDIVIVVLATLLGAGYDLYDAIRLANKAYGIVLGKFGTASISLNSFSLKSNLVLLQYYFN